MDVFNEELLKFWKALQLNDVRYIMVGGVATNLHGFQRTTEDIDVWLEDSLENRKRTRKAFREYGMGDFEPIERMQFIPGWTYFHLPIKRQSTVLKTRPMLQALNPFKNFRKKRKKGKTHTNLPFPPKSSKYFNRPLFFAPPSVSLRQI